MADKKLTALFVQKTKKPGFYNDGSGLYLSVEPNSKAWIFRFSWAGKERRMGLGPTRDVTLEEAREAARDARRLLRQVPPVDPIEHRRAIKAEALAQAQAAAAPVNTFDIVAERYIQAHKAGWRSAKHLAQWETSLATYATPVIGSMDVGSIGLDEVLRILRPIWTNKAETANRVRGRIEAVLDYARAHGWREGENPARWKGHLANLLPKKSKLTKVEHHAALPWADLPAAWEKLAGATSTSALCLRFLILTAARSGEARGATWAEIDMEAKTWTIPAERMKAENEHRVPLSDAAMAMLEAALPLKRDAAGLVFPGAVKGRPLSDVAVSGALAGVAEGYTVHGMRSTFRDWAAEATHYPREVAEAALAHTLKDKSEAAYARTDHLAKRRGLMQEWAAFSTTPPAEDAEPEGG